MLQKCSNNTSRNSLETLTYCFSLSLSLLHLIRELCVQAHSGHAQRIIVVIFISLIISHVGERLWSKNERIREREREREREKEREITVLPMVLFFVKFTQVSACDEQGHGPQSCSFNELVDLIACVITQIKPWQLFPCEVSDGEELLENVI